jgi:outer membrane lipoprotein-sorting protein
MNGKTVNLLTHELDRVRGAKAKHEKGTCIIGGILENIVEKKDHPAREALIWNNLFFGPSRRKVVKMRPDWEAGNSPFFLYPEIIDEVIKYAYIPKGIAEGVRQFAKQKAVEKAKAEQDAEKAAKPAAQQMGKIG